MQINEVKAFTIKDSRGEDTIAIKVTTSGGIFEASSPSGKSKGSHEAKSYIKTASGDAFTINTFKLLFKNVSLKEYQDLKKK